MKILNIILAIMFLAFAYLQLNDPDPIIWISIYVVMAVFAGLAVFGIHPRRFYLAILVIYVLYGLLYFPGVMEWLRQDDKSGLFDNVAKMEHLYIEESREFLGLLICDVVLIFYLLRYRK